MMPRTHSDEPRPRQSECVFITEHVGGNVMLRGEMRDGTTLLALVVPRENVDGELVEWMEEWVHAHDTSAPKFALVK